MERLITLAQAKAHLGITTPDGHVDDPMLQLKADAAQLFVLNYVGRTATGIALVATWTDPVETPADVQHAALDHVRGILSVPWRRSRLRERSPDSRRRR